MNELIEILRKTVVILGVLAPILKLIINRTNSLKNLNDQLSRVERFFHSGGTDLPPLLMEHAMGAAMGHLKLSAQEIPLILKQREPTQFIERYLQVKSYLRPDVASAKFVLKSAASSSLWGGIVRWLLFFLYGVFAGTSMWILLYRLPSLISSFDWLNTIFSFLISLIFGASAWFFLIEGRRITWALQLHASQI